MRMKAPVVLITSLLLGACSGGDTPAPEPGTVSEGNVFKGDVDALAKAKQAEKAIQDAAQQQRAVIDANQ
jgi:hypothetical protein